MSGDRRQEKRGRVGGRRGKGFAGRGQRARPATRKKESHRSYLVDANSRSFDNASRNPRGGFLTVVGGSLRLEALTEDIDE
jgi:hypothetical protein